MPRLNTRQWIVLLGAIITVFVLVTTANQKYTYSLNDLSAMIGSLDTTSPSLMKTHARITDNNSPEVLVKHEIETKVNELLKKKLASELEVERADMKEAMDGMKKKMKEAEREAQKAIKEKNAAFGAIQVHQQNIAFEEEGARYRKSVYSFRTGTDEEGNRLYDPAKNELVILSSFTDTFGRERTYEDFLTLLDGIKDIPHPKTSISFLIGDPDVFRRIDKYIEGVFNNIKNSENPEELSESYSKITLLHAPFLEDKLTLARNERQKADVQKQRRRALSEMRNFLLAHGIENEKYTLFLDSDIIELPEHMLTHFIQTDVDIATVRVDMKNPQGQVVHPDYDLNSWAGSRVKPTQEEEQKMDDDPNYFFEPRPAEDAVHMLDLSNNKAKFGLDDSPQAKYELKSVGGAVLYAKANVYRQGAIFPPYYAIGTKWERAEGWDGIETEGLCYVANRIGYKCWGFPNLKAFHTV